MGRLLAAFGVLVVTSSVLVEASTVDRLKLKTIRRTVSADKLNYIFTVEFQAPTQPDALWEKDAKNGRVILTGSMSYDAATQEGTAQLSTPGVNLQTFPGGAVKVYLGDLTSHYFSFTWNMWGDQDLTWDVDLPAAVITPSYDLAYSPGQSSDIVVELQNGRGKGVFCLRLTNLYGIYYAPAKGGVVTSMAYSLVQRTDRDQGGTTSTTYSFLTDRHTINGAFEGSTHCAVLDRENSPVFQAIGEIFVVRVHEASYTGPFPDSFVEARAFGFRRGQHAIRCLSGSSTCLGKCRATANDLASLEVFKISDDGTRTLIDSSSYVHFYQITLTANLTIPGQDVAGDYVCRATRKSGGPPAEDTFTVEEVTQRA